MPPLLLDDEEAVAVAVGLRTAAGGGDRRHRGDLAAGAGQAGAGAAAAAAAPGERAADVHGDGARDRGPAAVDAAVLTTLAAACRDRERMRFDYRDHDGAATVRGVEPYRLVNWGRRWYLVA